MVVHSYNHSAGAGGGENRRDRQVPWVTHWSGSSAHQWTPGSMKRLSQKWGGRWQRKMDFGPLPPRVHIYIHVRAYIHEHTHCTHTEGRFLKRIPKGWSKKCCQWVNPHSVINSSGPPLSHQPGGSEQYTVLRLTRSKVVYRWRDWEAGTHRQLSGSTKQSLELFLKISLLF